jgi:hypothetical protein
MAVLQHGNEKRMSNLTDLRNHIQIKLSKMVNQRHSIARLNQLFQNCAVYHLPMFLHAAYVC